MYDPTGRNRRSIRVPGYDYRWTGVYFVTICTHLRRYILGEVADSQMSLNEAGRLAEQSLLGLQSRFPSLRIDSHVIMPNHAHALLEIRAPSSEDQSSTLGSIVRHGRLPRAT